MNVGDRVWYWARRKGERAHKKVGQVVRLNAEGTVCSVYLEGWHVVPVQTVDVWRLEKME